MAVYAVLGGVPAYLEQFTDDLSLLDNLRQNLFQDVGLFRNDPDCLVGEQVQDLTNYQAVLAAIAGGARKPADIGLQAKLPHRSGADPYLSQLVKMDYVRRELPVTVPPVLATLFIHGNYGGVGGFSGARVGKQPVPISNLQKPSTKSQFSAETREFISKMKGNQAA